MMKKIYITVSLVMAFVLIQAATCRAESITIGDENVWIVITSGSTAGKYGVPVIITDPKGQRMGYDPRIDKWIIEFDAGYDKMMDTPYDMTEEVEREWEADPKLKEEYYESMGVKYDIAFNLMPGEYKIEAIGEGLTEYHLFIRVNHWITKKDEKTNDISFDGVIDTGQTNKFKFTYNPDPNVDKPGTGERIASPGSLKQDIILSRKIGWIDSDGIMNSLLKKAEAIEASIARGNKEAARNQLNAFINEVHAQKGKHIESFDPSPSYHRVKGQLVLQSAEDDAVKILLEDAQYLLDRL